MATKDNLKQWRAHVAVHQENREKIKAESAKAGKGQPPGHIVPPSQARLEAWAEEWGDAIDSDKPEVVAAAEQALRNRGFDPDYPPAPSE